MSVGIRGYQIRSKVGQLIEGSQFIPVAGTNRNRVIVPGMFVVATTAGGADGCRGANDTVDGGSGARKIIGLVKSVHNSKGDYLDSEYLGLTDAGFVTVWVDKAGADIVYSGLEDDGSIVPTDKSVGQVDGDPTYLGGNAINVASPEPVPNDKLDSSTGHATATQHAFRLIGEDKSLYNSLVDAGAPDEKMYLFTINASYKAG